jgi:hypothetical protein
MNMNANGSLRLKILLNAFLIANAPLIFAQSAETTTPPALAAARAQYNNALADDTRIYLTKLARLNAYASRTGDATLGLAVRREIASVVASQSPVPNRHSSTSIVGNRSTVADTGSKSRETPAKTISSVGDLESNLLNSTWVWYRWETFKLLPHGKAQESAIPAPTMTWEVDSYSPPVITGTTPTGIKYTMSLDSDLQSGTIKDGDGPGRITARVPAKQGS